MRLKTTFWSLIQAKCVRANDLNIFLAFLLHFKRTTTNFTVNVHRRSDLRLLLLSLDQFKSRIITKMLLPHQFSNDFLIGKSFCILSINSNCPNNITDDDDAFISRCFRSDFFFSLLLWFRETLPFKTRTRASAMHFAVPVFTQEPKQCWHKMLYPFSAIDKWKFQLKKRINDESSVRTIDGFSCRLFFIENLMYKEQWLIKENKTINIPIGLRNGFRVHEDGNKRGI